MLPPSRTTQHEPIYHEEQRFRQWWVLALVIVLAGLAWWTFIRQVIGGEPVGENPGPDWVVWLVWLVFGLGLPFLFGRMALVIEVTEAELLIRYRPFMRRTIPLAEIQEVRARKYNAITEYGGWGIKGWSKARRAYNVSGDRGVELTLRDGKKVMLGSQRADELAAVIEGQRPRRS
jgi:hypothetical protein